MGHLITTLVFPRLMGSLNPDVKGWFLESMRREPQAFEAAIRFIQLQFLAEAWILGMSPLPGIPDFRRSEDRDYLDQSGPSLDVQVRSWVRNRRDNLSFDPLLGRCVTRLEGETFVPIAVPEKPLPGWEGPAPSNLRR